MKQRFQRIVEAAFLDEIGPVTADELRTIDKNIWGLWRDQITERYQDYRKRPAEHKGPMAKCMYCESPVYIKTAANRGVSHPYFAHFSGANEECPWHHRGRNMKPDDLRRLQYNGQQASPFHARMCQQIAELAALDQRYVEHKVEEYVAPKNNEHGRFPDVYVKWRNFDGKDVGAFVIEFQMSNTFQTEISGRCIHYEREGIPLLWVLFGVDTQVVPKQNFIDVIRQHRGNAFVLDHSAVAASKKEKTLILSCFLQNEEGFDPPRLVRFDELTIPNSKRPYFEDRIVGPRLEIIKKQRQPWFAALKEWKSNGNKSAELRGFKRPESLLIAAAFSIVANANGYDTNYASKHPNISGMLNTYLSMGDFKNYTNLLRVLIQNTKMSYLLDQTVGDHLKRYASDFQVDKNSREWRILRKLIPEALDLIIRNEFKHLDALPDWARP